MHFINKNHNETASNFVHIVYTLYHISAVYSVTTVAPFPGGKAALT